jgi:hypothetical protein
LVDSTQVLTVGDELVDLEFAIHVVVDKIRKLGTALDATKGTALPLASCNKLEC